MPKTPLRAPPRPASQAVGPGSLRPPYAPEFRRQMVELVRSGRDPQDLGREFEPSAQAMRNWVADADRRDGRREPKPAVADAALSATERDEWPSSRHSTLLRRAEPLAPSARLRRENKQLRLERDILSRAAATLSHKCDENPAWFARETGVVPPNSSHS